MQAFFMLISSISIGYGQYFGQFIFLWIKFILTLSNNALFTSDRENIPIYIIKPPEQYRKVPIHESIFQSADKN